jgi:hypothetical protein
VRLPRDRRRILHRQFIARRRLSMNRPIRGPDRPMAQCPARATCPALPARLVPVRVGVLIRSILHFHLRAIRTTEGGSRAHVSCVSFLRLTASPMHMGLAGEEPLLPWDSPFAVVRPKRRGGR